MSKHGDPVGIGRIALPRTCQALGLALLLAACGAWAVDQPADKPEKKEAPAAGKDEPAKKDPKAMSPEEAEKAGFCVIDRKEYKLVYHADYEGQEYHFCSRDCQRKFKDSPAQYLGKAAAPVHKDEAKPAKETKEAKDAKTSKDAPPTKAKPKEKGAGKEGEAGDGMQGMGGAEGEAGDEMNGK